jgi:hypothetical protein
VVLRLAQGQIEATERGALVAADEGGRVEPAGAVEPALFQDEPDDGLDPRHEGAAGGGAVDIIEAYVGPVGNPVTLTLPARPVGGAIGP